ncbi:MULTISPECIES: DUF2913 family protein [Rahnella]|uniref:DUF2913 family protein n=1 Tax=Rahnella TaxID=34037 RepID=UPI003F6DD1F0
MTTAYQTRLTSELANLAWCILVAVRLVQQDGKAQSHLQQHLFIMRWLTTAQKQKRFPKTISRDINWLQGQGKRYGFMALWPILVIKLSTFTVQASVSWQFRVLYSASPTSLKPSKRWGGWIF